MSTIAKMTVITARMASAAEHQPADDLRGRRGAATGARRVRGLTVGGLAGLLTVRGLARLLTVGGLLTVSGLRGLTVTGLTGNLAGSTETGLLRGATETTGLLTETGLLRRTAETGLLSLLRGERVGRGLLRRRTPCGRRGRGRGRGTGVLAVVRRLLAGLDHLGRLGRGVGRWSWWLLTRSNHLRRAGAGQCRIAAGLLTALRLLGRLTALPRLVLGRLRSTHRVSNSLACASTC